jgi:leucine dehydrogenase
MTLQIERLACDGYEQVVHFSDDAFQCFIALHNTKLGPALGGCRLKWYDSPADALDDVLRLSKGMTYNSSLAGLDFGGGKCVVIAEQATRDIMLKVGECVNFFGGEYITAEDVGTTLQDTAIIGEISPSVAHLDGSPMTARGVLACMLAAAKHLGQWDSLDGVPIWIEGLGKVGMDLANRLHGHNNLYVTDLLTTRVDEAVANGAHPLTASDRKFIAVYAPCAMGQVVNAGNVAKLTYSIVCGSANNQLADEDYAELLRRNGVIYCPDFLANAGGVINAAFEMCPPYDAVLCEAATDLLGTLLTEVLAWADKEGKPPLTIAKSIAESRFL